MAIGIYLILNKLNNNKYIGQSKKIEQRWVNHIHDLREGTHTNRHLQNAWKKYGEKHFEFLVIQECELSELDFQEQYWFERLKPQYNISLNVFEWRMYTKNRSYLLDDVIPAGTFVRPEWHRQVYGNGEVARKKRMKGRL